MSATINANKSAITLKGSSDIVCEYLDFGVNSILYQRGIYPPEDFKTEENYGLLVYMSQDKRIKEFLNSTLGQLKVWLVERVVSKVSLVITNHRTQEVEERWDFNVEYEGDPNTITTRVSDKPLKDIQAEMRSILKQIIASVAFLPLLDCLCTFDLQVHTVGDFRVPDQWAESEGKEIKNAQSVKMRTLSTNIHKVQTVVTYKHEV